MFNDIQSDETLAGEKDSIGSGGALDTGSYKSVIKLAYGITATSGAKGVVLHAKTEEGREIRQTVYVTSGTAKGGKNYYQDKEGQNQPLPGFLLIDGLCLLAAGKPLKEMDIEEKVVSAYSKEAKAEVPTKVKMLVELLGKEIVIGVIKQTVDKNVKNDAGVYVPTGETRDENEIDKFFRASDLKTVAEIRAQAEAAAFHATWIAKWNSTVVRDKTKKVAGGTAGAPKAGAGAATKKPATSLFG